MADSKVSALSAASALTGAEQVHVVQSSNSVRSTTQAVANLFPDSAWGLKGDLTPSQITADQNNYDPTSLASASVLRLATDAARTITGLAGGADGRVIVIHNVGSFGITLADESASSTAANRFALPAAITIAPDGSVTLQYDSTSSRWRCVAKANGTVTYQVTLVGNAKLGGSGAGWVIDADNALPFQTLPASQTSEVLLVTIHGLQVGDVLTQVGVVGQVESAGNTVSGTLSVRKATVAAADHTDAEIGTDTVSVTADTALSVSNFGATGMTEVIAADEIIYATITMTTGASTDVALSGLSVTVLR
jgi:hypothetical protein